MASMYQLTEYRQAIWGNGSATILRAYARISINATSIMEYLWYTTETILSRIKALRDIA